MTTRGPSPKYDAFPSGCVIMSFEQVLQLVELAFGQAIETAAAAFDAPPAPALVDRKGLARALCVSLSAVDRLQREGCPRVMIGDSPRFRVQDVLAWLEARAAGGPLGVVEGGRK